MKRRVSVESCRSGPEVIQLMVSVFETQKVEGQDQEVPIGEMSLSFPAGTKPADMLDKIRDAGKQIEAAADEAKATRAELNKLLKEKVVT